MITLADGRVYTVEYRNGHAEDDVVMHVSSTFDLAAAWCAANADKLTHTSREHFAICCEVVDSDETSSGSLIASFTVADGLNDFREAAAAGGYEV